jgi:hypothetical protein
MACRVNRTREWGVRLLQEAASFNENSFLTLTYSDDKIPPGATLVKKDFQDFMKRFRKRLAPTKIKFYMCGEYGPKTHRPHYHAIIFGFKPPDLKTAFIKKERHIYYSPFLMDLWPFGTNTVGTVTYKSCRYVAQYIVDKLNGNKGKEFYGERLPPFSLMSKGLGKKWLKEHRDQVVNNKGMTFEGHKVSIPRYYKKMLQQDLSEELEYQAGEYEEQERKRIQERANHEGQTYHRTLEEARRQADATLNKKLSLFKSDDV